MASVLEEQPAKKDLVPLTVMKISANIARLKLAPPILSSGSMRRLQVPYVPEQMPASQPHSFPAPEPYSPFRRRGSMPAAVSYRSLPSLCVEREDSIPTGGKGQPDRDSPAWTLSPARSEYAGPTVEDCRPWGTGSSTPSASSETSDTWAPSSASPPNAPSKMLLAFESVQDWGRSSPSPERERYGEKDGEEMYSASNSPPRASAAHVGFDAATFGRAPEFRMA
ncbi:hypothetical protein T484DRAFT_2018502 [Baffinella frigidus]|nr:hypothetical protein T484DRAFT_2018502 [Cryptophyta sp. CCMP2293]